MQLQQRWSQHCLDVLLETHCTARQIMLWMLVGCNAAVEPLFAFIMLHFSPLNGPVSTASFCFRPAVYCMAC
jgi:hypothetical protein